MISPGAAAHACDTHYPWNTDDVVAPGVQNFKGGSVRVPDVDLSDT